jgi:hypothetical protein
MKITGSFLDDILKLIRQYVLGIYSGILLFADLLGHSQANQTGTGSCKRPPHLIPAVRR